MKIAIRKNNDYIYIDKNLKEEINYTEPPYNFTIIEIDDKYEDCLNIDFDDELNFDVDKYEKRKLKEINELKILELKRKLELTDYITNKLSEAISEYIETEDDSKVLELREKYAEELSNRELWRKEIRKLEEEIK